MLEYVDGSGDRSTRRVAPLAITGDQQGEEHFTVAYVDARCSSVRANRTFRVDRIAAMNDAATGEVLDIDRWASTLELGPPVVVGTLTQAQQATAREAPPPPVEAVASPRQGFSWRAIAVALFAGYLIGRWRVIALVVHLMHWKWGRWL